MMAALQELKGDVYAVEPFGWEYLERNGLRTWRSVDQVPPDLMFHGITTIDVVEHLPTPWTELNKLKNLLVASGWIYISSPNAKGLNARVYGSNWREAAKPGHLTFFTPSSIESMLTKCGFCDPRRLRWLIPYSANPAYRCLHYLLQCLRIDGELRYIAFSD